MKNAAKIVSEILTTASRHVRPGITTYLLDCVIEKEISDRGIYSYNKGYVQDGESTPFPAVSCISVNHCLAHGIPRPEVVLREGDLVKIDLGIVDGNGNCGDAMLTVAVGKLDPKDELLLRYAKKTLYAGIEQVRSGARMYDIASAMQRTADERKFAINHQLFGHGIGKEMHQDPYVPSTTNPHINEIDKVRYRSYLDAELEEGMVICIEPHLTFVDSNGVRNEDLGWEWYTADGRKSAAFEHMVKVTRNGYEILTSHIQKGI